MDDAAAESKNYSKNDGRQYSYLTCEFGGKYRGNKDPAKVRRRNTHSKKCGCGFRCVAVEAQPGQPRWFVRCLYGIFNHNLVSYFEGHVQRCKITEEQRQVIIQHLESVVKPCHIKLSLNSRYPDQPHIHIKQIYNVISKYRTKEKGGRTHAQHMLYLATQNGYIQAHEVNQETRALERVFLVDPEGLRLYRLYYYMVGMDTTYCTNKFRLALAQIIGQTQTGHSFIIAWGFLHNEQTESFEWFLVQVRALLGDNLAPNCIVTDYDKAEVNAVKQVFPKSHLLFCRWHHGKAVEAKAMKLLGVKDGNAFYNGRFQCLINALTEEDYNHHWSAIKVDCKKELVDYLWKTWFESHKEKIVSFWTNRVTHFGYTSTSKVESMHACLKGWFRTSTCNLETIWTWVYKAKGVHVDGIRKALKDSNTTSLTNVGYGNLFDFCHLKVSHKAIKLMQAEYDRVAVIGKGGHDVHAICGHVMHITHGLPCGCQMYVAFHLGESIWPDHIHAFWKDLVYENVDATKKEWDDGECHDPDNYILKI